jgi:hypothetical protein
VTAFAVRMLVAMIVDTRVRGSCTCVPSVEVRGIPPTLDISIEHDDDCPAAEIGGHVFVPRGEP